MRIRILIMGLIALLVASCGSSDRFEPMDMSLSDYDISIVEGSTATIEVFETINFVCDVDDPSIASLTVNYPFIEIAGLKPGIAVLRVNDGHKILRCKITVTEKASSPIVSDDTPRVVCKDLANLRYSTPGIVMSVNADASQFSFVNIVTGAYARISGNVLTVNDKCRVELTEILRTDTRIYLRGNDAEVVLDRSL